jgi:uncharacterized protein (DUF433 family)
MKAGTRMAAVRADELQDIVASSPDILGGTLVFKGTRVPVRTLWDYLEGGDSLDEFLDDFPTVSRAQALQVLRSARDDLLESLSVP